MTEPAMIDVVTLPAASVPVLERWLDAANVPALLVSVERLPDGRIVLQPLPDVDPTLVARIRKTLAEHADVLRRLA